MSSAPIDTVVHPLLSEGLKSAARTATSMTGAEFTSVLPHRMPSASLSRVRFLEANQAVVVSWLMFGGDIAGGAALLLSQPHAERLARGLMNSSATPTGDALISPIEEAANVIAHDALAPLARELPAALMMAPPRTAQGQFGAVWPQLLNSLLRTGAEDGTIFAGQLRGWEGECEIHFALCLGADFASRLSTLRTTTRIEVGLGELKHAEAPVVLRAASLGSCVAVVLYDPLTKKGVMSHVVMPHSTSPEKAAAQPGKFADTAVPALLKRLGSGSRVQAWLVGGANMFYGGASPMLQVGQRNVEGARAALKQHGLVAVEETGKNVGRTVELFTATGEVWVRSGADSRRLPTPQRGSAGLKLPDQRP